MIVRNEQSWVSRCDKPLVKLDGEKFWTNQLKKCYSTQYGFETCRIFNLKRQSRQKDERNPKILSKHMIPGQKGAGRYRTLKLTLGRLYRHRHSRFFGAPGNSSLKDHLHKAYVEIPEWFPARQSRFKIDDLKRIKRKYILEHRLQDHSSWVLC